ncbi:type II secretion system protein [bacterium]|nr:type II secretion system protein [bacterium]
MNSKNKKFAFTLAEGPHRTGNSATNFGKTPRLLRSAGFTLTEVLITIGVIGVVAAMTIPTLLANTNSSKFRSQFKKSFSTLKQSGIMSQAQYGFSYSDAKEACVDPSTDNPESVMSICAIFNGTLKGISYLGKGDTLKSSNGENYTIKGSPKGGYDPLTTNMSQYYIYSLADGSLIGKHVNSTMGFIDVNGFNLPNQEVNCKDGKVIDEGFKNYGMYETCIVPNKPSNMTDIYPIRFNLGESGLVPATNAAEYVLNTAK